MSSRCSPGTIRRKAYIRRTRSGRSVRVSSRCISDQGSPGKWTIVHRSQGIGALKKGGLSHYGYSVDAPVEQRHMALRRAVASDGALAVFRRLNAVANYTVRTSPSKSARFETDRNYVRSTFM